jgi:hypothetical protein
MKPGQEEALLRILGCERTAYATPDIVKNLKLLKENHFAPFSLRQKRVMRSKLGSDQMVMPVAEALRRIEAGEFTVENFLDAVDGN